MTIASTTNRMEYTGNGSTLTYAYTFKIFDDDDLRVIVKNPDTDVETVLTKTTHYTVTGVGGLSGGTIVLVAGAFAWIDGSSFFETGWTLVIRRVRPLLQETEIRNQGEFFAETHEDTFDHLVMVDQQQQNELDRSVKVAETVDPATFDATIPPAEASKLIGFNATADGLEVYDNPASALAGALAAQVAAELAKTHAETAETNAEIAETNAETAETNAEAAQAAAEAARDEAVAAADAVLIEVVQSSHGLAVGNVIRWNGTAYVKAQADSEANSAGVCGMVFSVEDTNNFVFINIGEVTGLSGLVSGSLYYLSAASAGAITATAPTTSGHVVKPCFLAVSTTAGMFFNQKGELLGAEGQFKKMVSGVPAWANPGYKLLYAQTVIQAGDNKTDSSTSEQAFATTYDIPANTLSAGKVIRVTLRGNTVGRANVETVYKVKLDSTVIWQTPTITLEPSEGLNCSFLISLDIICISAGATGTIESQGLIFYHGQGQDAGVEGQGNTAVITVDTTQALTLGLTVQWSATTGNSMQQRQLIVEQLG